MKQVHIRVDDDLYNELSYYSIMMEQTMQDCVREAVAYYVTDIRKKQREVSDRQFTFIDLFAGIGGIWYELLGMGWKIYWKAFGGLSLFKKWYSVRNLLW